MSKPLRFPVLAEKKAQGLTKRDIHRLDEIMAIRISRKERLRVIDTPQKRAELYLWHVAEHCMPLKGWLMDMLYDNPDFFERYDIDSPDTILRDSRELEILGLFEKPDKRVPQEVLVEE